MPIDAIVFMFPVVAPFRISHLLSLCLGAVAVDGRHRDVALGPETRGRWEKELLWTSDVLLLYTKVCIVYIVNIYNANHLFSQSELWFESILKLVPFRCHFVSKSTSTSISPKLWRFVVTCQALWCHQDILHRFNTRKTMVLEGEEDTRSKDTSPWH